MAGHCRREATVASGRSQAIGTAAHWGSCEVPIGTRQRDRVGGRIATIGGVSAEASGGAAYTPRLGSTLGRYRIDSWLGRGGMGVVLLATDLELERPVALKLLAPELAGETAFRERFLRESRLAAAIEHPGIVPVYEAGTVEGLLFIAMRYVPGQGGSPERLTNSNRVDMFPDVSPDGLAVVFSSGPYGNAELYVVAAEGGKAVALTRAMSHAVYGDWGFIATTSDPGPSATGTRPSPEGLTPGTP
jgi:hypothetical protein